MKLAVAVALGDLNRGLSVAIGCAQRPLGAWTMQEQAGDAPESVPGSEVEERWRVCMVEL